MAHKRVHFRGEARQALLAGVHALADAIAVTLGPKSKCVLLERKWGPPVVCNDGVTIAKEFSLPDPEQNIGAQMMRQAAERTGDAVGDGTSTATLLARAIVAEGMRNVAAGTSAVELKRGLDQGLRAVIEAVKTLSRPVEGRRETAQVATISAHNDAQLGELVADAVARVGREGVVTVEEAKATETVLDVVEGMQFDRGWVSPYFVTNSADMKAELAEPLVLVHDKRLSALKDILPLLERVAQAGRPLLVIAEEVDGEALATLVVNKLRGTLACCAVKAPGYGDRRKAMLQDIAILTGARFLAEEVGVKLEHVAEQDLGQAKRVVVDRDTTTIVGGGGNRAAIEGRCAEIRKQIGDTKSDYDREKLEERLAKLAGGVAVIRVGAPSEVEMKSRKEALEDAIAATKAALEEGIVPGGGWSLLRAIAAVETAEAAAAADGDRRTGLRILRRALEAPTRQIAENSAVDGGVVVDRVRHGEGALGFDAATGEYVDLLERGIIDPTKVVRVALENAVSVASLLLLTEATLTEIPEEAEKPRAPAGGEEY
jgi:chaperonin GroEL